MEEYYNRCFIVSTVVVFPVEQGLFSSLSALADLFAVLLLGGSHGLPLHVPGVVGTAGAQRDYVVDNVAWAGALAVAVGRAGVVLLEGVALLLGPGNAAAGIAVDGETLNRQEKTGSDRYREGGFGHTNGSAGGVIGATSRSGSIFSLIFATSRWM